MSLFFTIIFLLTSIMIVWGRTLIAEEEISRLQREHQQDIEELGRKLDESEKKVDAIRKQMQALKTTPREAPVLSSKVYPRG